MARTKGSYKRPSLPAGNKDVHRQEGGSGKFTRNFLEFASGRGGFGAARVSGKAGTKGQLDPYKPRFRERVVKEPSKVKKGTGAAAAKDPQARKLMRSSRKKKKGK